MQNDLGFSSEHISRALNNYQRNFPIVARPFASIGNELGLSEEQTIQLFQKLKEENKITRIGPVFKPNTLGASTLAAMQVPAECLVEVASFVSSLPEVNHNYERENILNLWFVVTAPDSQKLTAVLKYIEQHTQIKVHELRLEEEFRIDLGFNLTTTGKNYAIDRCEITATEALEEKARRLATRKSHKPTTKTTKVPLISDLSINNYSGRTVSDTSYSENPSTGFQNNFSEKLIAEIEKGLPLTAEPYKDIAIKLSVSEADVTTAISYLQSTEVIRRFGVVVRHRELGYTSNAMVVWNIPDNIVSQIGRDIVNNPSFQFVSLCYKRSRSLPEWNYNFY
jgi:DNA-binding Lrp family transcriptional regulator